MNTAAKKVDLYEAANQLLSQKGFLSDGRKKKEFSKGQYFFERKTIMRKPMGHKR